MAGQIVSTVLARAGRGEVGGLLTQFRHDGAGFVPQSTAVAVDERPPMATVAEYRAQLADAVVG
jgi:glucosyl-3-phosphoglycerate synthase